MAVEMTLAEKVLAVMRAEDFRNPVDRGAEPPFQRLGKHTELDVAAIDWRLYYGVAVGLARTEEPCEPIASVAERAGVAACEVFLEMNWDSPAADEVRAELRDTEAVA